MRKKFTTVLVFAFFLFSGCTTGAPSGGESEETALKIAQCLKQKGVQMYGAYWCPHCAEQKRMFGKKATEEIPYNECDPKGENSVTNTCLELKIEKYPTWIFPNGSRIGGVVPLSDLAKRAGCEVEATENPAS